MVGFSRVSRVSRVRITVTVRIMVRFSFNGANLYIAVAPPKLHLFRNAIITPSTFPINYVSSQVNAT